MIATADMLDTLKCLMLQEGYKQVQYHNLDMKCLEVEQDKDIFKTSVKYHMILSKGEQFGCNIDSDTLCNIETFVKAHPCTCQACSSNCVSFDINEVVSSVSCTGFQITELIFTP